MKQFNQVLGNTLIATVANNFIWFAITYWAYLETHSVLATSILGGLYLVAVALTGIWFGSIVDHTKKKQVMILSSIVSLIFYAAGLAAYLTAPADAFKTVASPLLWTVTTLLLAGVIVGNIRNIALTTVVTLLVPEDGRDKANGLVGTVIGLAFSITAFISGIGLAYMGMRGVIIATLVATVLTLLHMFTVEIPEKEIAHVEGQSQNQKIDLRGTIKVIKEVPGLPGLIFFNIINNLLGGVFMSLMDAYGLTLVNVQTWGTIWGFLSFGFIIGGAWIAKKGLGNEPIRTLFRTNIILWIIAIFFVIQPSIVLLCVGMLLYMSLIPFIEAAEQTVLQKVVPFERQGRVFGFAQSVEQSASPFTAFLIGPIAQFVFIPFMTTGAGVELIGSWFGVGPGRGIALVFIAAGLIGLVVTIIAMRSKSYHLLAAKYKEA